MKFFSHFESFAFKAFKFDDRASPMEYWCVMPIIWLLILAMVPGDARAFWNFLLARETPPLNPFYYESFMLFAVTFIPRLSLTVRRLHDSGKSGKWAKLPYVSLMSGTYLILAGLTTMVTMGAGNGGFGGGLAMFAIVASIVMGNAESAWEAIFASATVLNAMGWDAIIAILSEFTSPAQEISVRRGIHGASRGMESDPTLMLVVLFMIALPFITATLHLFFMISPSKADDGLGSNAPMTLASLRRKGEVSDNPFAGYKYLYKKSPEQDAAHKEAAKQEIRSLYQQRVLGNGTT